MTFNANHKNSESIKIIGIVGSPHKNGMTAKLTRRALDGAAFCGADTEMIYLADYKLKPCIGCGGNCWDTHRCVLDASFSELYERLQNADGLIMSVPVYCWQLNGLTQLFIDKMRWDTGSVMQPRNKRVAFGIACAGGSGTGCIFALQALYRYFYNWSFHGIQPLPVTRFNFNNSLEKAYSGGETMVKMIRGGIKPFKSLGEALEDLESLPYMKYNPLDELRFIINDLQSELCGSSHPLVRTLEEEAKLADEALKRGDRKTAAEHLSLAYDAGSRAWNEINKEHLE